MGTLATAARDAATNAVVDLLDGGTIVLRTAADAEVATGTFGTPAFGASSGGTATANAITQDSDATGGTVAKYALVTSGAADLVTGAAGVAGEVTLPSADVPAGAIVTFSSLTYTTPAS